MSALQGLENIFADLERLDGPGIMWKATGEDRPVTVTAQVADHEPMQMSLGAKQPLAATLVDFAARLQNLLAHPLGARGPACPVHRHALVPVLSNEPCWSCPKGSWSCAFGHYHESQWPPGPDIHAGIAAVILSMRMRRRATGGIQSLGARFQDGEWVARVSLYDGDAIQAVRDAAAPVPVDITVLPPETTQRTEDAEYRTLRYSGMTMAAEWRGTVHRAPAGDNCDFLIDATRVRLLAEHRTGPLGGPVILDAEGNPFAYEGDEAVLGGGSLPDGNAHLPETSTIFLAGRISIIKH